MSPTTRAYTSYLLATAYDGSFADGLAAVLPCYWIYAEVGAELLDRGSTDPRYQRWIDSYGGDEFAATVTEVLELADRTGPTLTPVEDAVARGHFVTTSRYEWMFFDAAYRRERPGRSEPPRLLAASYLGASSTRQRLRSRTLYVDGQDSRESSPTSGTPLPPTLTL